MERRTKEGIRRGYFLANARRKIITYSPSQSSLDLHLDLGGSTRAQHYLDKQRSRN